MFVFLVEGNFFYQFYHQFNLTDSYVPKFAYIKYNNCSIVNWLPLYISLIVIIESSNKNFCFKILKPLDL